MKAHDFAAKIIADSVSPKGIRLTTMQLCYPRFIHAEFMTHRVFSRNASSSRAIPVAKMIEQVRKNPAMPVHWGKNQPGMQASAEHDATVIVYDDIGDQYERSIQEAWGQAAEHAANMAQAMSEAGYHKQVVNRILEPFQWMHTIVTATDWDNFFALRDHHMADPNMEKLAKLMKAAMNGSEPISLMAGEWHLPYVQWERREGEQRFLCAVDFDVGYMPLSDAIKASVARCARVSYLNHDGSKPEIEKDLALYEQLVVRAEGNNDPIHASPAEHQATPDTKDPFEGWRNPRWHGNLTGWIQHRKMLEERVEVSNLSPFLSF